MLCATPIGNLGDAAARLGGELSQVDLIFAEDTRRAAKLLQALGVRTEVRSYFVGNESKRAVELEARLTAGDTVALITDAGMPAISDPGLSAVRAAVEAGAEITVVPGPSAVTAALAVSGLPADRFVFEGFLPRKGKERAFRLGEIARETRTVVFFSAKSRLEQDLADLSGQVRGDRPLVVARELTKRFEEIWRGDMSTAVRHWSQEKLKGEFTVVLAGAEPQSPGLSEGVAAVHDVIGNGASMTDAVRLVAVDLGISRRELYEAVLRSKE